MMKFAKILCIGDLIIDLYVHGEINRISPEAPIPILKVNRENYYVLGGCGNVARNICAANAKCHMISLAGNDNGKNIIKKLSKELMNFSFDLLVDKKRCTTIKTRFISDNQQVMRVDEENVSPISKKIEKNIFKKVQEKIDSYDVVVLSDYNKGVLTTNLIKQIISISKKKKKKVIIDPKRRDFSIYKGATIITPNFKELKEAASSFVSGDIEDDNKLVLKLSNSLIKKFNFETVVTTRSSDGISAVDKSGYSLHLPSKAKEVFDVSGAGDTVLAYLATSLSKGKSLKDAIMNSNQAAGVAVGKFGTAVVNSYELQTNNSKLCSIESLKEHLRNIREKKIIGFTNGCFDLIHAGHISYLKKAREKCDLLIVGLNSDKSVKKLKGKNRPINGHNDRAHILSSFPFIDKIILFEELTPINLIKKIRPNILFKGKDYKKKDVVGYNELSSWEGKVMLIDFVKNRSTSNIIDRIKANVT